LELADELVAPGVANSVANEPPDHSDLTFSRSPVHDACSTKEPGEKRGKRSWLEECSADNGEKRRYRVTERGPTKSNIWRIPGDVHASRSHDKAQQEWETVPASLQANDE